MKKMVMLGVVGLMTLACVGRADDPIGPILPPEQKATGKALTDNDIEQMLKTLGYQPTRQVYAGVTLHAFSVSRNGHNYNVGAVLSPNKKFFYLFAYVGNVLPPVDVVRSETLLKMLDLNQQIAPMAFVYDRQANMMKLQMGLYNEGIKAEDLAGYIPLFADRIQLGIDQLAGLNGALKG